MSGYSIVLPPPWQRIHLGSKVSGQVKAVVDRAMAKAPKEIPPDQLAPFRHRLEQQLNRQLEAAKDGGAVDFYFPTGEVHGVHLNASFVVSSVIPDALADESEVGSILAELIRDGAEAIDAGGTVWARTERVVHSEPDDLVGHPTSGRKVEYTTAMPQDGRRWVLVTFTTLGDGKPESEFTYLVVELFDAMMTTWRWAQEEIIDES